MPLQHLINFPLDIPYPPVHRRFGHIERVLYLDDGPRLHTQVKHSPFLLREIALLPEPLTLGFCELGFDVHFFLTREPLDLVLLVFLRTRATIRAIIAPSRIVALDKVGVAALTAVHNVCVELAPLIDMVKIGRAHV